MKRHLILLIVTCAAMSIPGIGQNPDIAAVRRKAESGDAKAQFDLAQAYWEGTGVPKDSAKGLDWLQKSATQGYAGAEVTIGIFYQNGVQVPKDPHQAAAWFRKAARQSSNDPKHAQTAQSDLATLATQGVISIAEADWRTSEPGSETVQHPKNMDAQGNDAKTSAAKNNHATPFSLSEVETGLTGGITNKRMATLVSQYGVDFSLTSGAKKSLASDGADDNLLQIIASSKR
jgi:hypothetical protein